MPMNEEVKGRLQPLSDSKLRVWQDMAERWPSGSTAPINADAFLSLIVEVKRQRAELTRLTEIADSVDPLVVRLGDVTTQLEAANALLRQVDVTVRQGYDMRNVLQSIQAHLSEPRT